LPHEQEFAMNTYRPTPSGNGHAVDRSMNTSRSHKQHKTKNSLRDVILGGQDGQRCRLAAKAKKLGRKILAQMATIVTLETLLP
jgi:hypothetical protein